jgi:hypothetical protein
MYAKFAFPQMETVPKHGLKREKKFLSLILGIQLPHIVKFRAGGT